MDRRMRLSLLAIGLLLGSVLTAYVIFQIAPLDPLAQFRTADGKLSIPGGHLTADLQRLLFPGPAPTTYWSYEMTRSSWPTLSISASQHDIPQSSYSAPRPIRPVGTDSLKVFFAALLKLPRDIVSFFMVDAAAACTGGNCFWIGGTGNFSDNTHWSLSTGGVACACTPGATDTVTFDASSGAGTATQNNATFTSGAVVMTNSSVTVADGDNTWKVGGNWSDNGHLAFTNCSSGGFNGLVEFTATGSVTYASSGGGTTFCNITIDSGVTSTFTTDGVGIAAVLTVTGHMRFSGSDIRVFIRNDKNTANPLVVSGDINGFNATMDTLYFFTMNGALIHIPASTYTNMNLRMFPQNTVAGDGVEYRADGAVSAAQLDFFCAASKPYFFNSQTFNMTFTNTTSINYVTVATCNFGIKATSGSWALSGQLDWSQSGGNSGYIQFGSTLWTVSGNWKNTSTSASWNKGTSTVTFNSSTALSPMTFGNSTNYVGGVEFNNLTFDPNSAVSPTHVIGGNKLTIGGALSITNSNAGGAVGLTDATNNKGIAAGTVTVGTRGFLTMGSATITMSGNWDSSAGTFTQGTSTVDFAASANITTVGSGGQAIFYNLTIDITKTGTLKNSTGIGNVLTVNGTLTDDTTGRTIFIRNDAGGTDPIVIGGSGSIAATSFGLITMYLYTQAGSTIDIPGSTYTNTYWNFSPTNTVAGLGVQYKLLGNFTAKLWTLVQRSGAPFYINSQTFNVSLDGGGSNSCIQDGPVAAAKTGIQATSGTWTLAGCVNGLSITDAANSVNFYIKFGSSVWNVTGAWLNSVTTNSTDWSAGTGTVNLTHTTSKTISNPNLGSTAQFNNLTFDPNNGGATPTWTIASNKLIVAGALTITNSTVGGTETLTDATNNKGITSGSVVVGTRGTLIMGSATITNSGNWDSSAGAFTYGTSTILVAGSGKTYTFGAGSFYNFNTNANNTSFDNVSVAAGGTLTGGSVTLTVSGNWNSSAGTFTFGTSMILVTGSGKTYTFGAGSFYNLDMNGNDTTFDNARIAASGTLTVGAATITFGSLTITNTTASMIKDGFVLHSIDMSTSGGNIALTTWSNYDGGVGATRWTFNPSVAGATVTITQRGLLPGVSYFLTRDGNAIDTQVADGSGSITFSIVGGWSSHVMSIQRLTGGGGSTPPPVVTPPPSSPPPSSGFYGVSNQDIAFVALAVAVIAAIILFLSYLLGIGRSLRPWLWLALGMALLVWLVFH